MRSKCCCCTRRPPPRAPRALRQPRNVVWSWSHRVIRDTVSAGPKVPTVVVGDHWGTGSVESRMSRQEPPACHPSRTSQSDERPYSPGWLLSTLNFGTVSYPHLTLP